MQGLTLERYQRTLDSLRYVQTAGLDGKPQAGNVGGADSLRALISAQMDSVGLQQRRASKATEAWAAFEAGH